MGRGITSASQHSHGSFNLSHFGVSALQVAAGGTVTRGLSVRCDPTSHTHGSCSPSSPAPFSLFPSRFIFSLPLLNFPSIQLFFLLHFSSILTCFFVFSLPFSFFLASSRPPSISLFSFLLYKYTVSKLYSRRLISFSVLIYSVIFSSYLTFFSSQYSFLSITGVFPQSGFLVL